MFKIFKSKQFLHLGPVAFVTGFCLLSYELVAARLLAPYIGSSIYVWTSVIGVIILALSLGYAYGGWLADRRVKPADISWLLLFSAAGVALTLLGYTAILEAIVAVIADPRLQGLLASFVLFAPTSFILGSISPYLARLSVRSIETTGRVVAGLEATNAIGGIVGTLTTGFILLGYFGSNQILVLLVGMLAVASWAASDRQYVLERAVVTSALVILVGFALSIRLPSDVLAKIDTPSTRYLVTEENEVERPFRALVTGPGAWQSGNFTDGSSELVFWYSRKMAEIISQAPHKNNILVLGGGAFSLPRYLGETYPDSDVTVVEIDPELSKIAKEYFFYKNPGNIEVINQDARAFLGKNNKTYDIVIVDAFSDTNVPFSLTTEEYARTLGRPTHSDSAVLVNIIASSEKACGELFGGIDGSYKTAFASSAYFYESNQVPGARQNIIATYSKQPLVWLDQKTATKPNLPKSSQFTDNFTPTDRLNFECLRQSS